MEAGQAQPVVRVAVADAHVVVLVDVDRLEQRLIDEPTVRVVGVLVDVGGVGQQFQGVVEVLSRSRVVAVVRADPVFDGLQRGGDPVLLALEEVEWDGAGVVGLEQLLLLAFELGSPGREVGEFGGAFGHHLVEPGVNHRRDRLDRFRVELHLGVEALDEPFDLLDQHRLPGAVASS
ncbi:hypothetical protein [Cellulomonas hominis]|uniref:hypothetical protein n=1 Tax=Cellulomonas hominis TaxID=156981 RepID=UPI00161585A5|nr:hypothetical protein [Cellulomonas hominis]